MSAFFTRTLLCYLSLFAILLTAGCSGNDSSQQSRPNILLILTDDLGNNDIASWGDGSVPTPTLDELSQESVRFRRHFTDSTCSPSRAALLTGQHPASIGFLADGLGLSSDIETLPESLKKLGYRTAHIGKWHVGEAIEYPEIQPGKHGFDYWFGMLNHFVLRGPNPGGELIRQQPTHINPWLQEDGLPPQQHQGFLDDLLTDKAIELIGDTNQPWFINLWLFSPHTPYQPSPRFASEFPDTAEGHYLSLLKNIDFNVSRLLESLKQRGVLENTIVVFASDNGGPNLARDNNYPLEGIKTTYLDGGVRSPLLLHWPKHFENAEITAATHITDIYPTLLALAGGKQPENIMGRNLMPLLQGEEVTQTKELYWMAEGGQWGMTYGGHLLDRNEQFFRDLYDGYQTKPTAPAIGAADTTSVDTNQALERKQANQLIKSAERRLRVLPFNWQPGTANETAMLTGRDFQRAPVFSGYSLGLALGELPSTDTPQTVLEQPGIWRIDWLTDRRLKVTIGDVEQFSEPLPATSASCNALVFSFHVKPSSTFPFPGPASSRSLIYWNNQVLLDSDTLLKRPNSAEALANPTYIGADAEHKQPFQSNLLKKPIIINKLLTVKQDGYNLNDMTADLCTEI